MTAPEFQTSLKTRLLYPWRNWVANKLDSRRTLMLANAVMILGVVPLGFSPSLPFTLVAAGIIGIGLGGLLVSSIFGLMMPAFGYDTLLDFQPATVDLGFRLFLTIPTAIGFLLAIFLLWLYPLHGRRLRDIKAALEAKSHPATDQ
jgi:GPH family glycoside/pentoside/hexuronide:cation symporter